MTWGTGGNRPTTAAGSTRRRKPRPQVPATRPQTSDNHKPSPIPPNNAISKSDDALIGLAFGSPSHPPTSFCTPRIETVPLELNPTLRRYYPSLDKSAQMQSRKWKKFGSLFKSRDAVRRDEIPSGPTIGLPTGLVVLDKSPTSQTRMLEQHKLRPIQPDQHQGDAPLSSTENTTLSKPGTSEKHIKSEAELVSRPSTATDASFWCETPTRPPLPKLELRIPTAPLDRYSVMFQNLPAATRSSSLLARRSKTLESLKSFEDSRPPTRDRDHPLPHSAIEPLTPLMPPRRLTTPTTKSPAGSKYSLFPPTSSTEVKIAGQVTALEDGRHGTGQLKRSLTSPARLSPMQDHFAGAKPEPLNLKGTTSNERKVNRRVFDKEAANGIFSDEQVMSSPDDKTASTDREAPWSSAHSFQSSFSSATTIDEIFFDIKSFRDSKGLEDGQFVMTRPASAAVQMARTRSKRAASTTRPRLPEDAQSDEPNDSLTALPPPPLTTAGVPSSVNTKHTSVNTVYFDEAIADVERLTSPTAMSESEGLPPITFTSPSAVTSPSSQNKAQSSITTPAAKMSSSGTTHTPTDHRFTGQSSLTREEVGHLIPSPVSEGKEDLSPTNASESTLTPTAATQPRQGQAEGQTKKIVSSRIAAVKRVDRPIHDSPTLPQGPPSPQPAAITGSPSISRSDDKPPPVPKKDAKYIPLSKYAAKNTVSKIEQAGIRPTRPVRSNTDNSTNVTHPPRTASLVHKERSSTLPSSLHPPRPLPVEASSPSSALRGLEIAIPPPSPRPNAPVVAKAEVAVARTVSLSRKQSARVHVPGPRLVAARRAEVARQQPQSRPPPSPPSQKRGESEQKSILGHRHHRNTSKSLSKDKIISFIRGESSDSDKEKEREKERARLQLEKQVAMREKAKEKGRERDRDRDRDRERDREREKERGKLNDARDASPAVARGGAHDNNLLETQRWDIIDKSKWEILEKKAYSPVVVQAERGHRPGMSVGVVVENA